MDDKVFVSFKSARKILLELLNNNDFSDDKEVVDAIHKVISKLSVAKAGMELSRILIDERCRIFIPAYSDKELKLQQLAKTVFFYFLLYPDGAHLQRLDEDEEVLNKIYSIVVQDRNVDALRLKKSIANLVDPAGNRIYEVCSIVRRALARVIPVDVIDQYAIVGERGKRHKVLLDRSLVEIRCGKLGELLNE